MIRKSNARTHIKARGRGVRKALTFLLAAATLLSALGFTASAADPPAKLVRLFVSSATDETTLETTVTVKARVDAGTNAIAGVQLAFTYDSNVLNEPTVDIDDAFANASVTSEANAANQAAKEAGMYRVKRDAGANKGEVRLLGVFNGAAATGYTSLDLIATATFTVKGALPTDLTTLFAVIPTGEKTAPFYSLMGVMSESTATGIELTADNTEILLETSGVSVSGTVSSYNPKNKTTISLMQNGTEIYGTEIKAVETGSGQVEQGFTIENVAAGTYDLVVTKDTHLTYTITGVTVDSSNISLVKTITLLAGDVTGDGFIDGADISKIQLTQNYEKVPPENIETDISGDGYVDGADVSIVQLRINYEKSIANDCIISYTLFIG